MGGSPALLLTCNQEFTTYNTEKKLSYLRHNMHVFYSWKWLLKWRLFLANIVNKIIFIEVTEGVGNDGKHKSPELGLNV